MSVSLNVKNIDDVDVNGKMRGMENRLSEAEKVSRWTQNVITALVLALFLGFAGCFVTVTAMLVDAWRGKQAAYQSLVDKVQEQNGRIGDLAREIERSRPPAEAASSTRH